MSSELRRLWNNAGGQAPDSWKIVPLESLLRDNKSIAVGVMYPGPDTPGGIPLIKVGDIKDGTIPVKPSYCISDKTNEEHKRTQLIGDELLITLVGNPGECVVVNPAMAGWNPARAIATIRLKKPEIRIYLKTVLESTPSKHLIDAVLNTTVQKTLNLKDIRKLPIPLPSNQIVQEISEIADALTNCIALLRETNKTLEAIAQAIFKSWFVDFDPVRAKQESREPEGMDADTAALFPDSFEESELGLIPKGWIYCSFQDAVTIFDSKRVPLSGQDRAKRQGQYPYYGAAALMDRIDDYLFDGVYFLMGEDGSVADAEGYPITQYVWGKFWVNNHAHILQGKNGISTEHVMLFAKRTSILPYMTGAVQAKLSQSNMWRIPFLMPLKAISESFGELIAPLYNRLRHNSDKAQTLAQLRDTLLPRLISGQLRLPDAESMVEKAIS